MINPTQDDQKRIKAARFVVFNDYREKVSLSLTRDHKLTPDAKTDFALTEDPLWDTRRRLPANSFRLGWRCVEKLWNDQQLAVHRQYENGNTPLILGGYSVHCKTTLKANEYLNRERTEIEQYLIIELWTERRSYRDLQQAVDRLTEANELIGKELKKLRGVASYPPSCYQEFLEIGLTRFISRYLKSADGSDILKCLRDPGDRLKMIHSFVLNTRRLAFGPERCGTLSKAQQVIDALNVRWPTTYSTISTVIPITMALLLVLTWALPLVPLWTAIVGLTFAFLMVLELLPARHKGLRVVLRQPGNIAGLGFFGIAMFGIAYAICALLSGKELGTVVSLGYPFLVSAGLGVSVGVLGPTPAGAALIIAHVQILLFLAGLAGVVALLLRIENNSSRRN